ncbi:hypothetical protein PNA2_0006 [Pyrococcus sp. NA2]|uniref:phosphate-starvation-inducible PsiE family protein n=1 Tax=Pyrococcus sp. (strain NA2) TaxID=342949 RepID=UPI000209AC8D|nr:phosphate-starvation-inducible PsiE family protein [Pyrococcus sp. NA2]AEC50924.1 hypothetical protein PNA2_0006 [Pyrococcus sp. NA2]
MEKVTGILDTIFNIIAWILEVIIIALIGMSIYKTISYLIGFNLESTLEEFLFVLILLEIYELLYLYLRQHHVSMRRIVELGVIAIVRKLMVVKDYRDMNPFTLIGLASVILALGWIYVNLKQQEE